jgi:hypothetical protein
MKKVTTAILMLQRMCRDSLLCAGVTKPSVSRQVSVASTNGSPVRLGMAFQIVYM